MSDESKNNDNRIASLEKGKYSRKDDTNFDRLMVFTDTRPAESLKLNEANHEFVDASLNYSDSDNQAFEQLMNVSGSVKGSRSSGDSNGTSFLLNGYSGNDSSRFDELESAIESSSKPSQDSFAPLEQKPDQNSIEYSLADKLAFSRLMLEGQGEDDGYVIELDVIEPVNETSHIKIIDFDKKKSREKSRSRPGQSQIKIRYFD